MSELKYRIETNIKINDGDLDMFIKEYYGHDYSTGAILEMRDGTYSTGELKIDSVYGGLENPDITKFKSGKDVWIHPSDFLEELVNKRIIPEGRYLIEVD